MAIFNKTAQAEPFRVKSLGQYDVEYAEIEAKLLDFSNQHSITVREIGQLEGDIIARPAPKIRVGVAALLGETVDLSLHGRHERLKELRHHVADLEQAIGIIRQRLTERREQASAAACEVVRPEYGRRVARLVEALQAVADARDDYESLCDDLEAHDVSWLRLGIFKPTWLGDRRDGHIQRFVREAKESGYGA